MQTSTVGQAPATTLIPEHKGKGIEVIEITTVTEELGESSGTAGNYSNLELVPDIDLSLLDGEDLAQGWWKHYDPPKELIWTCKDTARMEDGLDFKQWIEQLKTTLQDVQNGTTTENSTTPTTAEGPILDPGHIAPEVSLDAIEVIPPQRSPQARNRLRVSVSSMGGARSVAELESPTSPGSRADSRSITSSLNSKKSKKRSSIQEFHVSSSLIYTPYYSSLPTNDNTVMSMPISPRVEQVKRFWKKRNGESECSSCLDDHKNKKLATLACQHKYCPTCLETLIKTAIQDESLWPPHCCIQDIPLKTIKSALQRKDLYAYNDKAKEYAVPAAQRIYCAQAACSAWIPPTSGLITCPKCKSGVCRTCRGAAHPAQEDCPEDFELQATLEEGERQGWRRCFQCRTMVERTDGCNHMTCKCNAEFCYICGSLWKTCACRGDEQVQRQAARNELEAAERAIREQEEAEIQAAIAAAQEMIRREQEEQARIERAEELRRTKAAEKERMMQEQWLRKVDAEYDAAQQIISIIHQRKWDMIHERHQKEREDLETKRIGYETEINERRSAEMGTLEEKHAREREEQSVRFTQEQETLSNKQASEEDDYWFELQTFLKGRPNKEGRQKVLMEKLSASQAEQMDVLHQQQEKESKKLALLLKEQLMNLETVVAKTREEVKQNTTTRIKDTTRHQYADMQWFEAVKIAQAKKLAGLEHVAKGDVEHRERFYSEFALRVKK